MRVYQIYLATDSISFLAPEAVLKLAASHFEGIEYELIKIPNVKTSEKALEIVQDAKRNEPSIIIFSTILVKVRDTFIMKSLELRVACHDVLSPIVKSLGNLFKSSPIYQQGHIWKLNDEYYRRINAIEFAINNDDGRSISSIEKADIVIVGVSRTSKTPLSIYLAYHNYLVVNIPLVTHSKSFDFLYQVPSKKIIGLTINTERLNQIRAERNISMGVGRDSSYSDLNSIIEELEFADSIMKRLGCPIIDISNKAVEETAEIIMKIINPHKK